MENLSTLSTPASLLVGVVLTLGYSPREASVLAYSWYSGTYESSNPECQKGEKPR